LKKNEIWIKYTIRSIVLIFIFMNTIAAFHAYRFTHFNNSTIEKTKISEKLSLGQRIKILIFGVSNPRPENDIVPNVAFETLKIKSNKVIECWRIKADKSKGTVILFHGFGGCKSSLLDKSAVFHKLGYSTLLVDFMGSGGSEGNQTTIGYFEALQVKSCFDFMKEKGEENLYLFGTSMGAVAIMKAISDFNLEPTGIIIECPFGTMYETVCARFRTLGAPVFPMAGLLVFWGGLQNRFWAFGHNPSEYAKKIKCPVLLLYGAKDEKVSKKEIDKIFSNLTGRKILKTYKYAGHENYLIKYRKEWTEDVSKFLLK